MIKHTEIKHPSGAVSHPDIAQSTAEKCDRQEVTAEWYMTVGIDHDVQLWAFIDGQAEFNLDPWRMVDGPEGMPNARYFVQRNQLVRVA